MALIRNKPISPSPHTQDRLAKIKKCTFCSRSSSSSTFFLSLPPHLSFLSLDTNTCKLNISVIGVSELKLSPATSMSGSLLWLSKLLPAVKTKQPCYCCVPQKTTTLMKVDSWSGQAEMTQLLCFLCLTLILTVGILLLFGTIYCIIYCINMFNILYIDKSTWLT